MTNHPKDLPTHHRWNSPTLGSMADEFEWYHILKKDGHWYGVYETYTSHVFNINEKLRKATEAEKEVYGQRDYH